DVIVRAAACAAAISSLVALAPPYAAPVNAAVRLPRLMLWAWERPEDLRGLPSGVGVAFLAQTMTVGGDRMTIRPRLPRPRGGPATLVVAVTRIEGPPQPSNPPSAAPVADAIARTAALPQVAGVQVDFDAAASQRPFYRALVERLRARLAPDVALSITALASWCAGDAW